LKIVESGDLTTFIGINGQSMQCLIDELQKQNGYRYDMQSYVSGT